ncbi:MAG: hypothetical protein JNK60_20530 [Acidobacteria bacterium]|nr:hypothetical protein [Acidobacteriota bacterium]
MSEALTLLVVSSGGRRYGLPVPQVASVDVAPVEVAGDAAALASALGAPVSGVSTHTVATSSGGRFGVSEVLGLSDLPLGRLRRLPGLLRRFVPASVLGAAVGDGDSLFLVLDLSKLDALDAFPETRT